MRHALPHRLRVASLRLMTCVLTLVWLASLYLLVEALIAADRPLGLIFASYWSTVSSLTLSAVTAWLLKRII